jgi:predicted hydrocarbon binding protein
MAAQLCQHGVVGIGSNALRSLRASLSQDLGIDAGVTTLQAMGYAAGDELYRSFCDWLPSHTDIATPHELDAAALSEVLSEFFGALGWGSVRIERVGALGLNLFAADWAESLPAEDAGPSCFFSTGLLASFFTALADGSPLAVMELQCRAQGDVECQFLVGSPETLSAVYDAVSRGEGYAAVLQS